MENSKQLQAPWQQSSNNTTTEKRHSRGLRNACVADDSKKWRLDTDCRSVGENNFDDSTLAGSNITKLKCYFGPQWNGWNGTVLKAMIFSYAAGNGRVQDIQHGVFTSEDNSSEIELSNGEYLQQVDIYKGNVIDAIWLTTSNGQTLKCDDGQPSAKHWSQKASAGNFMGGVKGYVSVGPGDSSVCTYPNFQSLTFQQYPGTISSSSISSNSKEDEIKTAHLSLFTVCSLCLAWLSLLSLGRRRRYLPRTRQKSTIIFSLSASPIPSPSLLLRNHFHD